MVFVWIEFYVQLDSLFDCFIASIAIMMYRLKSSYPCNEKLEFITNSRRLNTSPMVMIKWARFFSHKRKITEGLPIPFESFNPISGDNAFNYLTHITLCSVSSFFLLLRRILNYLGTSQLLINFKMPYGSSRQKYTSWWNYQVRKFFWTGTV